MSDAVVCYLMCVIYEQWTTNNELWTMNYPFVRYVLYHKTSWITSEILEIQELATEGTEDTEKADK